MDDVTGTIITGTVTAVMGAVLAWLLETFRRGSRASLDRIQQQISIIKEQINDLERKLEGSDRNVTKLIGTVNTSLKVQSERNRSFERTFEKMNKDLDTVEKLVKYGKVIIRD